MGKTYTSASSPSLNAAPIEASHPLRSGEFDYWVDAATFRDPDTLVGQKVVLVADSTGRMEIL